jgi:two-component system LytT family response regulator
MKIRAVIIDREPNVSSFLRNCVQSTFPDISIRGEAFDYVDAAALLRAVNPQLVFSNIDILNKMRTTQDFSHFGVVCVSEQIEDAIPAIRQNACGFILKPLNVSDVVISVGSAIRNFSERCDFSDVKMEMSPDSPSLPHTKLVGIPTMDGIEFLCADEIVRCEGLQKCTRIVSMRRDNLISAYNIGEFKKLLGEYGFFPCHKSHLINLMYVKKLTREGFIFLGDNDAVPLARRKRIEFLQHLRHL